jgi:hypothetical protein
MNPPSSTISKARKSPTSSNLQDCGGASPDRPNESTSKLNLLLSQAPAYTNAPRPELEWLMRQNLVSGEQTSGIWWRAEDCPRHLGPEFLTTGFALLMQILTILLPVVLAFESRLNVTQWSIVYHLPPVFVHEKPVAGPASAIARHPIDESKVYFGGQSNCVGGLIADQQDSLVERNA